MSQDDEGEMTSIPDDDDDYDPYDPGLSGEEIDSPPQSATNLDAQDPEAYSYHCLSFADAKKSLESDAIELSEKLKLSLEHTQYLMQCFSYDITKLTDTYFENREKLLEEKNLEPKINAQVSPSSEFCPICYEKSDLVKLRCLHAFCQSCICIHLKTNITDGNALKIECLDCNVLLERDFVVGSIKEVQLIDKYDKFLLRNLVETHPLYTCCPGPDCTCIVKVEFSASKPITCKFCRVTFCYACKDSYHAPSPCDQFRSWLKKCQDDSETMNYICANTKDCPHCKVSIEKSGGCNHMCCRHCHYDFCWMCLGSWKTHASEYYECSKYRADPTLGENHNSARESLNKYLHYYSRWKNHIQSLALEEQTRNQINTHIHEQIKQNKGTWIDWQYLLDAVDLLLKCRYTLKFTYAYAYFLEGPWKEVFEHHQGQLEREIENLSWKVEHSKQADTVDIVQQMNITKQKRLTLLHQYIPESQAEATSNED